MKSAETLEPLTSNQQVGGSSPPGVAISFLLFIVMPKRSRLPKGHKFPVCAGSAWLAIRRGPCAVWLNRFTEAGKSDEPEGPGYRRALTKVYLENGSEVDAHIYELS